MMLFSIGYQGRKITKIIGILQAKRVRYLLDVRSKPRSRNPVYNGARVAAALAGAGIEYIWRGDTLGGMADIDESAISDLAGLIRSAGDNYCLMCMERDPDQCHRSFEIARRLKKYRVEVEHIL